MKTEIMDVMCKTLTVEKDELVEDKSLTDSIGVDSTEIVELKVALEKKFSIKITDSEITKNSTPLEIVALVEKKKS